MSNNYDNHSPLDFSFDFNSSSKKKKDSASPENGDNFNDWDDYNNYDDEYNEYDDEYGLDDSEPYSIFCPNCNSILNVEPDSEFINCYNCNYYIDLFSDNFEYCEDTDYEEDDNSLSTSKPQYPKHGIKLNNSAPLLSFFYVLYKTRSLDSTFKICLGEFYTKKPLRYLLTLSLIIIIIGLFLSDFSQDVHGYQMKNTILEGNAISFNKARMSKEPFRLEKVGKLYATRITANFNSNDVFVTCNLKLIKIEKNGQEKIIALHRVRLYTVSCSNIGRGGRRYHYNDVYRDSWREFTLREPGYYKLKLQIDRSKGLAPVEIEASIMADVVDNSSYDSISNIILFIGCLLLFAAYTLEKFELI